MKPLEAFDRLTSAVMSHYDELPDSMKKEVQHINFFMLALARDRLKVATDIKQILSEASGRLRIAIASLTNWDRYSEGLNEQFIALINKMNAVYGVEVIIEELEKVMDKLCEGYSILL